MRVLKKLAAAAALAVAISALTACGNDAPALFPQNPDTPNAGTNPFGNNNLAGELDAQIIKSKVTSADSTAKEFIVTVNSWIADDVAAGGDEKRRCEIKIVMDNGKATITDDSRKNNWEGRKASSNGKNGSPESLKERFEADYSARTFTAKVFVDDSGYAVYSWCVQEEAGYNGDAPSFEDFKAGEYAWKSEDRVGVTRGGIIIGTSPKLVYPKSMTSEPEPFKKPNAGTNPFGNNNLAGELDAQIIKSKVTSADSTAKEFITTVNTWIADNVAAGGEEKYACELKIVMENGKAAVTDSTRNNNWDKRTGCPESLKEFFERYYSNRTFTAGVIIDYSGYAVYAWYVPNDPQYGGAAPSAEDFKTGYYGWGTDMDGLTSKNVIIGTSPKLAGRPVGGFDER